VLDLDTLGDARALAAILRPPTAPGHTQPSRDRGRYRYDRAVTGSERPFDLRVGEDRRPQLPGTSVTILISDGALSEPDYASCAALRSRHQGVVVPLLLGARPEMVEAYTRTFGAGVVMEEPGDLTRHVLAFLRARGRTRSV
jgi:hypothetical protein